jgi:hypothetical protein
MSAPASPQVYLNDRLGQHWILYPYTASSPLTPVTTYTTNPFPLTGGPSTAGLAYDSVNYNVFLPGGYAGAGTSSGGINYNTVNMNAVNASSAGSVLTPVAMPTGSFRPTQAAFDSTNQWVAVADYLFGLTGWKSISGPAIEQLTTYGTYQPGSGNGAIQAQGVAIYAGVAYTCCQVNGVDSFTSWNFSSGASLTPVAVTSLALSSSYTNMLYDSTHSLVFITSNNIAGGLTVLNPSTGAQVGSSPYSTIPSGGSGAQDCRGICQIVDSVNNYILVLNFASNSIAVFQQNSSGYPATLMGTYSTGLVSPNAIAAISTGTHTYSVYITNYNGQGGGIVVYTLNTSSYSMTYEGIYQAGSQFVSLVVA